jgi:hypothetical protein
VIHSTSVRLGGMDRRRHHDAGVEIDRALRFVGQMRRPVLHPGDLRLGVGRALPIGVRQRLALALAVEARQVLGARRDAALAFGLIAVVKSEFAALVVIAAAPTSS